MATEFRAAANKMRHDNHAAPGSLTERTFAVPANFLIISNTDSTNPAAVSFDGSNSFTIPAGASASFDMAKQVSYWTSGTSSPALEVVFGSEI